MAWPERLWSGVNRERGPGRRGLVQCGRRAAPAESAAERGPGIGAPFSAQVRTLSETVRLDARTKLLNPKFYEGMLKSGYEGTREITKRLRNTMGWSATAGAVDNFVYEVPLGTAVPSRPKL